ncbi:MAG: formate/nitrite transporter family protein, partial [Desulfuromonadales bacterium]|nr:formate/nitrite transporter family protein [Desulfuromonadales bacterium]NIS41062.1 formate/nitrite transporter family protein [Desulfuromonadales bacterium]
GFEHSVANMYFIPTGLFLSNGLGREVDGLDLAGFIGNLVPVTLGNIIGG